MNIKRKLFLAITVLTISVKAHSQWDTTTPANTEAVSLGDDRIRELKTDIQTSLRILGTGDFPGSDTSNPRYYSHLATATFEPSGNDAPLGRQIVNTSSTCIEMVNNAGVWTCLDVVPSSSVTAGKLAADVAGLGLSGGATLPLTVNVDSTTFNFNGDTVTIRNQGIQGVMIKNGDITGTQLNSTFTVSGRPGFFTYVNGTISNVTGNATQLTVTFSNEDFDAHSDVTNSTFTAPVTGLYHFDACITLGQDSSHDSGSSYVFLVATGKTIQQSSIIGTVATNTQDVQCAPLSTTISMAAGDTAHIEIMAEGLAGAGTKDMDILGVSSSIRRAWWSGYLLP